MEVTALLEKIDRLKPLPPTGGKLLEILSDPDGSLDRLVQVIRYDPGITANLLRICNSAYFGLRKKITSLKQAVAYLGLEKVAVLAMAGACPPGLASAHQGYDLAEGELWKYSVASALIAQHLGARKGADNLAFLFTSALLKDLGKIALSTGVLEEQGRILAAVRERGASFLEAEKEILGIDHAELGARIAERWNFPSAMVSVIRYHHDPLRAPAGDDAVSIVYLADAICMMVGIGVGADGLSYKYHREVTNRLCFSTVDVESTMAAFGEELRVVEEMVTLAEGH